MRRAFTSAMLSPGFFMKPTDENCKSPRPAFTFCRAAFFKSSLFPRGVFNMSSAAIRIEEFFLSASASKREYRENTGTVLGCSVSAASIELPSNRGPSRNSTSRWRQALVYVARRYLRVPPVDISREFHRSESTVSLMWGRHRFEVESSPETQQLLRSLNPIKSPDSA